MTVASLLPDRMGPAHTELKGKIVITSENNTTKKKVGIPKVTRFMIFKTHTEGLYKEPFALHTTKVNNEINYFK